MKMKRPSRVTITLPPRSFRASSSSWRLCNPSASELLCCSSSRATSTRHSSRLRGGSFHSFTAGTLVSLDLDHAAPRAEVDHVGGTDLVLGSPRFVDVAADGEGWPLRLDRLQDGRTAQVVAVARLIAVALGWGVDHQHGALRAVFEALSGLLLVEVEAPVPGRDRDPRAESEELRAVDLGALPVEDGRRLPPLARRAQGVLGLVVAGHQDRRHRDRAEGADRLLETFLDRGEVAGGDHDVGLGGALGEAGGLIQVPVQIAEGEQPHGPQSATAGWLRSFEDPQEGIAGCVYGAFSGMSFGLVALIAMGVTRRRPGRSECRRCGSARPGRTRPRAVRPTRTRPGRGREGRADGAPPASPPRARADQARLPRRLIRPRAWSGCPPAAGSRAR